jgi:hypothetical protein
MSRFWRRAALAAAGFLTLAIGPADAQTVVVKNAPAGTAIELRWNGDAVATATAGADGIGTVAFPANRLGRPETDARVFVDVCDAVRRITLVERAVQPPAPEAGCIRTEVGQFVLLQPTTSLLVDLAPAAPTLWVRQGPVPPTWLLNVAAEPAERPRRPAPKGIILFADGGFTEFGKFAASACGTLSCDKKAFRRGFGVGAAIWPSQYFGLEGGFHKAANATAAGDETLYSYDSTLETQVITASALVGIPVGRVRFYGRGGATHHRATFHTAQTIEPRTLTIGGVPRTVPGGSQEFELRTAGWGWIFGAGLEGWLSRSFALYGEANYGALKGGARDDGDGKLDDRITALKFGIRIRLGG